MSTPIASLQPNNDTPPIKSDIDDPIVQQVIGDMDPNLNAHTQPQPQLQPQQQQTQPQPQLQTTQQPHPSTPQVYLRNDSVSKNDNTYEIVKQSVIVAIIALIAFYPATMDYVRKILDIEAINDNELLVRAVLVAIGYYAIFYLAKV